jgi:hypothetical protein
VVKDDVRVFKSMTLQGAGRQDCEGAHAKRRTTPKPIVIGLSSNSRHERPQTEACFLLQSGATPPIARLAMSSDQRVSSRGLWRTFHVQSPSRLGKAHLYLASRLSVELPIPASTH